MHLSGVKNFNRWPLSLLFGTTFELYNSFKMNWLKFTANDVRLVRAVQYTI